MNYYISDLHLFHKNVTDEGSNFDNRPFKTLDEMHKTIKERWNNTVTNADHVYILGDLAWKENEDAIQFVSTLRGNKHLILGNHCKATDQRYRQLFVEVVNYKEINNVTKPVEGVIENGWGTRFVDLAYINKITEQLKVGVENEYR